MPSPLPSTFASAAAAAANNTQETPRRDSEWPRRMNGPQTFRRPSLATSTSHSRDLPAAGGASASSSSGAGAGTGTGGGGATTTTTTAPPLPTGGPASASASASGSAAADHPTSPITTSYNKDHLLAIYKTASTTPGWPAAAVADFFLADWNPRVPSVAAAAVAAAGLSSTSGDAGSGGGVDDLTSLGPWGKEKDNESGLLGVGVGGKSAKSAAQKVGPEICWDHTGGMEPLSLIEMDDTERELFSTTVNSPLKPPPAKSTSNTPATNATIDLLSSSSTTNTPLSLATPSRKSSLAPFGPDGALNTPSSTLSSTRPGSRRRDTTDTGSLGAAASPTTTTLTPGGSTGGAASRFFKGLRDRDAFGLNAGGDDEEGGRKDSVDAAFAGLKRGSNAGAVAAAGGAGPWSNPGGGFSAFGNFPLSKAAAGGGKEGDKRPSLATPGRGESRFKNLLSRDKDGNGKGRDKGGDEVKKEDASAGAAADDGDGWTSVGKTRKMRSETNPFADEDDMPQLSQTSAAAAGAGNVRFGGNNANANNNGMRSMDMDMDMDMPAVQLPSDIQAELSGDNFDISFGLPAGLRELVTDAPTPGSGAVTPSNQNRKNDDGRAAGGENDLNSPTNTNPYREGIEGDNDNGHGHDGANQNQQQGLNDDTARATGAAGAAPGLTNLSQLRDEAIGSHPSSPFTGFRRLDVGGNPTVSGADRSQTSSTAPGAAGRPFSGLAGFGAGFPGLSGLGTGPAGSMVSSPVTGHAGPAGVGAPGSGTATPTRGAFGDPIFGNMGGMKGFSGGPMGLGAGMMGMDMGMGMNMGMNMNMNMGMNMNMMGGGGMPGMQGMQGGMGGMGMGMSPGLGMASPAAQSATGPVTSSGRQSKMGALFGAAGSGGNANTGDGEKGTEGQTQSRASPFEGATPGQTRTPGGLLNPLGGLDIGGFGVFGGPSQIAPPPLPQQIPPTAGADAELSHAATASQEKINLPASQQRQMVMPDRMRWIYRDPQGNTQGPWSGLEMHDWFKAGFFTAELQVKKLEDEEYEPLAQLVRRIGNSREPFLVPQIGVPHGPEPSQPSQWGASGNNVAGNTGAGAASAAPGNNAATGPNGAGTATGIAQPPFAGSFPSFGTTLTADQQNALERRKQEEQYLMARQKEHLAQQQAIMRLQAQAQAQAQAQQQQQQQAQHQAQAHQGMGVSPPTGVNAGLQGQAAGAGGPGGVSAPGHPLLGMLSPDMLGGMNLGGFGGAGGNVPGAPDELPGLFDRLNVGGNRGQFPFGGAVGVGAPRPQQPQSQSQPQPQQQQQQQQPADAHAQNVQNILQDRAKLAAEQEQFNRANEDGGLDAQAREERLRQFQDLRDEQSQSQSQSQQQQQQQQAVPAAETKKEEVSKAATKQQKVKSEAPSLTEQVQKAAAAQQKQAQAQAQAQAQNQSVWGKVESNVAAPFPPPQAQSPLPAPSAQRSRSNVAENLAATSNEQVPTALETAPPVSAPAPPPAAPASIAPWAKDVAEAPKVKGPSLKEIQEAEARKAAKAEELAAAARALAAEQERLNQPPPPAPGLPSTANWASSASAANAKEDRTPGIPATSVWGKQGANKASGATPAKKTLAQIQKEEEARKQKFAAQQAAAANAAASAAAATGPNAAQSSAVNAGGASAVNAATPAGKRYADLAGKMAQSTQSTPGAASGMLSNASVGGGAWTTVGAGGKVKTPAPVPAVAAARTTPVATVVKPRSVPVAPVKPAAAAATTASSSVNNTTRALEELNKWAKNALRNGMNSSINVDDFVQQLAILPAESEIISDCVYAHSTTLDGRRFGEEYVRRRKLADKGVVESGGVVSDHTEGWNEVAKKGPARQHEDHPAEFKVVTKKKGKR